ncbi:MAG TPA: hypothetical protein VL309_07335 [Vicinamibacterales bacterium]|nr:hypothetical protein [Vicinamibacterales bacterium]
MARTILMAFALATMVSFAATAGAQGEASAKWRQLGETTASVLIDHDTIVALPPYDSFHRIKFKVGDARITLLRIVALYDEGKPDRVDLRERIEPGSESRAIELPTAGKRHLRKLEFWYEAGGTRRGVHVTAFGMK